MAVQIFLSSFCPDIFSTENRHDFIKPDSDGLHKALDKADNLFKGGKKDRGDEKPSEFIMTSKH